MVNRRIDILRKPHPTLTKLGTDLSVPDGCLTDVIKLYRSGLEAHKLDSVIFGHIGNNHLHVNIIPKTPAEYSTGKELYREWAKQVVNWGGSVSAEHGIGKLKIDLLEIMAGADGISAMRELKQIFDPLGILNPGTLFTPNKK